MARVSLLGIPFDCVTEDEAVSALRAFLRGTAQRHVVTPNNEMLAEAHRNFAFRSVLQSTDLNLPDSTGILLGARWTGQHLPARVTGVDVVTKLCCELDAEHSVFFLGGRRAVGRRASEALQAMNPQLNVAGAYEGSPHAEDAEDIVRFINDAKPHVLLVAYGAPAQELWIAEHLRKMPSVRIAMGVGGTFDFLAGDIRRAPRFVRSMGLEWLWRFAKEPSRWRRMWRAVVVFPMYVLRYGRGT